MPPVALHKVGAERKVYFNLLALLLGLQRMRSAARFGFPPGRSVIGEAWRDWGVRLAARGREQGGAGTSFSRDGHSYSPHRPWLQPRWGRWVRGPVPRGWGTPRGGTLPGAPLARGPSGVAPLLRCSGSAAERRGGVGRWKGARGCRGG